MGTSLAGLEGRSSPAQNFLRSYRSRGPKQVARRPRALAKGLPLATERLTVGQFLDRWLADSVKPTVRPRTYESYENTVRLRLEPTLGKLRLERLTLQHAQSLLSLKGSELSARSVGYVRSVLCLALNQALRWGLEARKVAALVSAPRTVRYEITPLSCEQARALLEVAKGTRLEAFYSVSLLLDLRRGEVLGLRWQDVNFDQQTLQVVQTIQRIPHKLTSDGSGGLVASEPKTERSRRTLSLPEGVIRAVKLQRARQATERLAAGLSWRDSGLVFTSPTGSPLEPKSVHRDFKRLLAKAKLPTTIRLHTCAIPPPACSLLRAPRCA